jgi:Ca2+-transporting ATPase
MEKGDPDVMKQAPRPPTEPVINREMVIGIAVISIVDMIAILCVFYFALQCYPGQLEAAQTIAFVALCTSELLRAFTARSECHSVFSVGVLSNRWMVWAVSASFMLVMIVVYVPFLRPFFGTIPLTAGDWLMMLPFFLASPVAMELLKLRFQRRADEKADDDDIFSSTRIISNTQPQLIHASGSKGGNIMLRILIPIDDSPNCRFAVRHVIGQFMDNTAMEVHLVNVQPPFTRHIAQFASRRSLQEYHDKEAEKALGPVRELLDRFGVPYAAHVKVGDKAKCITDEARRLHCDQIVMSTARKNSLTRLIENSVTNKVIQLTSIPVDVIAGDEVSKWERYGIPAALGAALGLFFAIAD